MYNVWVERLLAAVRQSPDHACVVSRYPAAVLADDDLKALDRCRLNYKVGAIANRRIAFDRNRSRHTGLEIPGMSFVDDDRVLSIAIEITAQPDILIVQAVHRDARNTLQIIRSWHRVVYRNIDRISITHNLVTAVSYAAVRQS